MIKCPFCGSEDFEVFDTTGGIDGEEVTHFCVCLDCDKQYYIVYEFSRIEVDD